MDRETAIKNAIDYANDVKKVFSPDAIILYGSYVNGMPNPDSDIDVAVIFDGYFGDWLRDSSLLWKLTRNTSALIEPILLDRTQDPSGFVHDIMNTGILIG